MYLIRDLKKGSVRAFDALYDLYFSQIYSYCLQISKSPQRAADITQDVFLKLWEHRSRIKSEESVSPFLFKTAKNRLISSYQESLKSKLYEEYILYTHSQDIDHRSNLEYRDFLIILNKALNDLPRVEREVVILSRFKLMSNKEIAKNLHLSEQTIKNRIVLGLKHLKQLLNKFGQLSIFYFPLTEIFRYFQIH